MASAWDVPSVGWVIIVTGWFLSPIIGKLLPNILSCLGFDPSEKLTQLEIHILPELEDTLAAVDQERMMQRGKKPQSSKDALDKMAAMLRHTREDAEDIVDDGKLKIAAGDIFYGAVMACIARCNRICLWIARMVRGGAAWLLQWARSSSLSRWFLRPVKTCIARFNSSCLWIARIVRDGAVWLLQWARSCSLFRLLHMSEEESLPVSTPSVPIPVPASAAPSDEQAVPAATIAAPSHEQAVPAATSAAPLYEQAVPAATIAAPSDEQATPSARWLSCLCSSFDIFKNCCRSIFYWLVHAIGVASFYRDWSYKEIGITNNRDNAGLLDSLLTAISRWNLKKRIEKVESTISEVNKSPLVVIASKSALKDIANNNRSRIRAASKHKVFGREALRDSIMAMLCETPHSDAPSSGTSACYSVIGIYGVAGSGKTTFARYIRDYVKEECKGLFDTIICIHVSETFSVDDLFHEMLKDITKDEHSNISDREKLEEKLKESLHGKRFFLILDDLWVKTKTDTQLEELLSPLNVGEKGSKILVTARTTVAARAACADKLIEMPDLDKDEYLKMLMHYALDGTNIPQEPFIPVGREIAERLCGSPIAAVTVAGQLGANPTIGCWESIAKLDLLDLDGPIGALHWSYLQLDPNIRRCFEFFHIFPRGLKLRQVRLVFLWIAHGLVKTRYDTEDMEDVAESYIQVLVSCSFLQQERGLDGTVSYRIHDLVRDMLNKVTGNDYLGIKNESSRRGEGWKGDIHPDVRHLFIQNYDEKLFTEKKILGLKFLRTLIINIVGRYLQVEEVIDSISKKLPKLRVFIFALDTMYDPVRQDRKFSVLESVGQLKHLRYFAFRTNRSFKITSPSTLNKVQHIQLLDFGDNDISEFTFAELVNLRHIFCWRRAELRYLGRLTSLQTLPAFKVRNEQGCELKQLSDLNKLRGVLHIGGLENVKSKEEALEANLAAKKRLIHLQLEYDTRCSPEVQADVLEGMCPPVGLQRLDISNFVGLRYPDWMVGKHSRCPKYLQELRLFSCSQPGPASGLAEAFPHLRVLVVWDCSWDTLPANMEHLTSLKKLWIGSCKNIQSLPSLPQSLEKFLLDGCNDEFMKSCQTVGHPNWQKIEHIPSKLFC